MAQVRWHSTGDWQATKRRVSKTGARRAAGDELPAIFRSAVFEEDDRLDVHAVYDVKATNANTNETTVCTEMTSGVASPARSR